MSGDECSDFKNAIGRPAKAGLSGNGIFTETGLRRELSRTKVLAIRASIISKQTDPSNPPFFSWARYFAFFRNFFIKTHEKLKYYSLAMDFGP